MNNFFKQTIIIITIMIIVITLTMFVLEKNIFDNFICLENNIEYNCNFITMLFNSSLWNMFKYILISIIIFVLLPINIVKYLNIYKSKNKWKK